MTLLPLNLKVVTILFLEVSFSICWYDRQCPHSSHRIFRIQSECNGNSTIYNCLYNTKNRTYNEFCENNEEARAGLKYVISGAFRNVKCSTQRYQPITFWSNRSTDCLYLKSQCSETGQIIFDKTSTIRDSNCLCDYSRNYAFVSPPHNPCFCTPSVEDCSCYIKQCPHSTILSPDYKCVSFNSTHKDFNCKHVTHIKTNESDVITFHKDDEKHKVWIRSAPIGFTVILLVGCIITAGTVMQGRKIKLGVGENDQIVLKENIDNVEHIQSKSKEVLQIEKVQLQVSVSKINESDVHGCTPVMKACCEGNFNGVQMLINEGADINHTDFDGQNVMLWSCVGGNNDIVNLLIDKGCNVHQPRNDGKTPLMVACGERHLSTVKLLIDKDGDINSIDTLGQNLFYWSCLGGDNEIVNLMIDKGFNVNTPRNDGKTPLMVACGQGHLLTVKLLIKVGAHITTTDMRGNTSFDWSCIGGNTDVMKLLMN